MMKKEKESKKDEKSGTRSIPWRNIVGMILLISLVGSVIFAAVRLAFAPADNTGTGERMKSDYVLMLVQCTLGLVMMFLPGLLEKRLHIEIPNIITVLFFVFLYCAIYLGEVRSFYYLIPYWDSYLHLFSGVMLGALGFSLISILNDNPRLSVSLSPLFIGLFAFCFAVAMGALWEIYEFSFDGILGLNMQKFRLEDGTQLVGRAALADTMKDIIVDCAGALIAAVAGVLLGRKKLPRKNDV